MTLLITDGLPRGLGYMEIDQRNVYAPIPAGMRHLKCDTYTCSHCTTVVAMNPNRKRERYKCKGCNHHVCDNCAAELASGKSCITFKQRMESDFERATRQLASGSILLP